MSKYDVARKTVDVFGAVVSGISTSASVVVIGELFKNAVANDNRPWVKGFGCVGSVITGAVIATTFNEAVVEPTVEEIKDVITMREVGARIDEILETED